MACVLREKENCRYLIFQKRIDKTTRVVLRREAEQTARELRILPDRDNYGARNPVGDLPEADW